MADVILDATSIPRQLTGAGRYAVGLLTALANRLDRPSVEVFTTRASHGYFAHSAPCWRARVVAPQSRILRLAYQEVALGSRARASGARLLHGLHYQLPASRGLARVVTIHDLTLIEHPEWHDRTKVRYFGYALRAALRRADAIIVPSRFTERRLRERFHPSQPIAVVYHGVEGVPQVDHRLRRSSRRSFVVLGTLEPRKNLVRILEAFDRVAATEDDVVLRFVGRRGWGLRAFDEARRRMRHPDRVEELGFVPDHVVATVLAEASALIYPSLEEGFGLPVLEALAAGLRVVTSRGSVMEEIAGGFAILVDPYAVESIADGMVRALRESRAPEVIEAQIARARSFRWEDAALATLEVYRSLGVL